MTGGQEVTEDSGPDEQEVNLLKEELDLFPETAESEKMWKKVDLYIFECVCVCSERILLLA